MSRAEFIDKYVNSQSASYSRREDLADIQQGNAQEKPSVRSMSDTTKMIPCYPMNVSVKVPDDPDPNVLTLPLCTVLPRCGGCCEPVPGIKCLPLSTSTVPVTVYRSVNDGQLPLKFSPEILNMEVHTACSCGCSIKPSDCSPKIHNYSSSTCSCRCINENERSNCRTPKKWDETLCRCVCQHLENCLEDEVFNFRTCKCEDLEDLVKLNQRASPAGLSSPAANHLCRPGFTPAVVSGVRVCQPSSLPSNPRSIPPEFPFSRPDQRRRR